MQVCTGDYEFIDDLYCKKDSDGRFHCEEKDSEGLVRPAVIYPNGSMYWYRHGIRHRECKDKEGEFLPAVLDYVGESKMRPGHLTYTLEYYLDGVLSNVRHYCGDCGGEIDISTRKNSCTCETNATFKSNPVDRVEDDLDSYCPSAKKNQ